MSYFDEDFLISILDVSFKITEVEILDGGGKRPTLLFNNKEDSIFLPQDLFLSIVQDLNSVFLNTEIFSEVSIEAIEVGSFEWRNKLITGRERILRWINKPDSEKTIGDTIVMNGVIISALAGIVSGMVKYSGEKPMIGIPIAGSNKVISKIEKSPSPPPGHFNVSYNLNIKIDLSESLLIDEPLSNKENAKKELKDKVLKQLHESGEYTTSDLMLMKELFENGSNFLIMDTRKND